jgi:murein DD-endopeptidase MepM/ murein hydrolase activator NlpD
LKKFKNVIVLFILVLVIFIPTNINANNKITDVQQKIKENKEKREKNNAELKELNSIANSVEKEIKKLDLEENNLNLQIDGTELEIEELNSKIIASEVAIEQLNVSIDENNTLLERRLRASYKRGEVGYLEIILNSENLIDAMTRMDMIQLIVKDDVELLGQIQIQKSNLEELKTIQESNRKGKEDKKLELLTSKQELSKKQNEKSAYIAVLEKDIKEKMRQEELLKKADKEFEQLLLKYQNEKKYVGGVMQYPLPLEHTRITSSFGTRPHPIYGYMSTHRGTDIACPTGTEVYAANGGKVIVAGTHSQFGNYIIIDHGGKIATLYAHNSKLLVKVGQEVTRGQVIAKSGSTGMSTGPHLHFEVRENGVSVDAMKYITNKQ